MLKMRATISLLIFVFPINLSKSAYSDVGFGRSLRPMISVQQAGTGGIDLEGRQATGTIINGETIIFEPGLRWMGAGISLGIGEISRLRVEVFNLTASEIKRTVEDRNGLYNGEQGNLEYGELGGRGEFQFKLLNSNIFWAGLIGRASSLTQYLPSGKKSGIAFEPGAIGGYKAGMGRTWLLWGLFGPYGKSLEDAYSSQYTVGTAYEVDDSQLLFNGHEGYSIGVDGQMVEGALWQCGIGGVYSFHQMGQGGLKYFFRSGVRYAEKSAQIWQPRGGLGVRWEDEEHFVLQLDYSIIPMGDLGSYQYIGISIRLADYVGREGSDRNESADLSGTPKVAVLEEKESSNKVIYFHPMRGQRAVVNIQVKGVSVLKADLLDRSGVLQASLEGGRTVVQGWQSIEWDGTLVPGVFAPFGLPYIIRVYHGNESEDFNVTPLTD